MPLQGSSLRLHEHPSWSEGSERERGEKVRDCTGEAKDNGQVELNSYGQNKLLIVSGARCKVQGAK